MADGTVSRFAYRAFISYSHRDKAWADWLHKALESYRVPRRLVGLTTAVGVIPSRLLPIFRDRDEFASATDLGRKVNEALAQSANLIVICSPRSARSHWVDEEVLAFKRLGGAERIFCLIVDGEPNASTLPGREAEECFTEALRFTLGADGQPTQQRTEPIAADARPGKDRKSNAKLKLIAGLLDVGFDRLRQREQQRRAQRMTAIAVLAVGVMAVTTVLAIAALISRRAAVDAEHKAVLAQQAAERRQKQAEGLVDFMLGDLTDKLEAESRGDILLSVYDQAMAYFASLPTTDVNVTALAQRARTLEMIGSARMRQGQLAGALEAFKASTAISSALATAAPADMGRQSAYARTVLYVGLAQARMGHQVDALHEYETAQQVLQSALKREPGNLDLMLQLSFCQNNLGNALLALGQPEAAQAAYGAMLAASRTLVAATPPDLDGPRESLIYAHLDLADLALQQGVLAVAIAHYRAADTAGIDADRREPNDNNLRAFMARARTEFGAAVALIGDPASGLGDLQQAVEVLEQLTKSDPTNTDDQVDLATAA